VLPTLALNNTSDRHLAHVKFSGERTLRYSPEGVTPTDRQHVLSRQVSMSVFLARPWGGPSLAPHVPVVIGPRPKKQMRRVAAGRIVAAVEDTQARRNRPMRQYPRKAMCQYNARTVVESTVTPPAPATASFPAQIVIRAAINLFQESFFSCGFGRLRMHLPRLLRWVPCPWLLQQRRGLFVPPFYQIGGRN
jgi:hypothetical protein